MNLDPGWRPKLVALDLDGTVVGYEEKGLPSRRMRDAVSAVVEAGVPVIIATGRPVWDALPTAEALGLDGIQLVCSNGALVYDAQLHVVLHEVTFDARLAGERLAERMPAAGFAVEYGVEGFRTTAKFPQNFPSQFVGVVEFDELVSAPTRRMVCRAEVYTVEEAAGLAAEALSEGGYNWDIGYSCWIDVMPPGVDKSTGVALVASDLGVAAADVVAIGDGTNDVELFTWAGFSVAMGQSVDSVQSAADMVTSNVEDDGAALILEQWFS